MTQTALRERVAAVRAFNRFWTNQMGLLGKGLLSTPYTLTEARVIYELAQAEETELKELRQRLHLDSGYLSRIIARFRTDGLIDVQRSSDDGRRRVARLTPRGSEVFALLNDRSSSEVAAMLEHLSEPQQERVAAAMRSIERTIAGPTARRTPRLRGLCSGDLGWVVQRHGAIYAEEYGWDQTFEALVARVCADYGSGHDPERESAWIAEVDGEPAGCIFCTKRDELTAQLRLLLVEPWARGLGVGSRLVRECIRFARRAGYKQMMLWTNDVLVSARRIYEAAGFELREEERHHSFGADLVGQNWWLDLSATREPESRPAPGCGW